MQGARIFLNFGGMQKQNDYSSLMRGLVLKLENKHELSVACGSEFNSKYNKVLSSKQLAEEICKATISITQPGFNSVYESLMLERITIILPPQNYGQHQFVKYLKEYLDGYAFIDWEDILEDFTPDWKGYNLIDETLRMRMEILEMRISNLMDEKLKLLRESYNLGACVMDKQRVLLKKVKLI